MPILIAFLILLGIVVSTAGEDVGRNIFSGLKGIFNSPTFTLLSPPDFSKIFEERKKKETPRRKKSSPPNYQSQKIQENQIENQLFTPGLAEKQPKKQEKNLDRSFYVRKIVFESISPEKIVLKNISQEPINITGWKIKSRWRGTFTIPKGIKVLYPQIFKNIDDIILQPGQRALIQKGISPAFYQRNFLPNKCFGYLKRDIKNLPGPNVCYNRKPSIEEISYLKPECQEFILKEINYKACTPPDISKNLAVSLDSICVNYIQNLLDFTYEGCVAKFSKDKDFFSNTWYIYSSSEFVHPLHDVVELRDKDGLLVEKKIY